MNIIAVKNIKSGEILAYCQSREIATKSVLISVSKLSDEEKFQALQYYELVEIFVMTQPDHL